METLLLNAEDKNDLKTAAELIKKGEVVGMPTETVYGLAADALNPEAIAKIFEAKGRPRDNPLIVHLSDVSQIDEYAVNIPAEAYRLAGLFMPGPLTLVLPKKDIIPDVTSGGLDTVGIRIPADKTARGLISLCGRPIAAPSANISGKPSPTCARHVMDDLNGKIAAVIDGGSCKVGIESSVVSIENGAIRLLRPGFVTAMRIEAAGFKVIIDKSVDGAVREEEKAPSPGMKYAHYSPDAEIFITDGDLNEFIGVMSAYKSDPGVYAVIFDRDEKDYPYDRRLTYGDTSEQQAERLFSVLRRLDALGAKRAHFRCPSKEGVGFAVYNRLVRASGFEFIPD